MRTKVAISPGTLKTQDNLYIEALREIDEYQSLDSILFTN